MSPQIEQFVQVGMRAVIRDLQDYVEANTLDAQPLDSHRLQAYLLAQLITAGGYDSSHLDDDIYFAALKEPAPEPDSAHG